MPTSHSSPAARTSGASTPWGSGAGVRNGHGSEPSSGRVMASRASSVPSRASIPAWLSRADMAERPFMRLPWRVAARCAASRRRGGSR